MPQIRIEVSEHVDISISEFLSECSKNEKLELLKRLSSCSLTENIRAETVEDQLKIECLMELFKKCNLNKLEDILKNLKK